MRYLLLLSAIAVVSFSSCKNSSTAKGENGITYKTPVQYNDYIVNRQTDMMKKVIEFGKIADTNLNAASDALKNYSTEVDKMINDLKGMPAYNGDSSLRDAAVKSFSFYKKIFQNEYVQILDIRKKGEAVTEEDVAETNKIVEKITNEEKGFDEAFQKAQKDFAAKNKMDLRENAAQKDLQKELEDMNKK